MRDFNFLHLNTTNKYTNFPQSLGKLTAYSFSFSPILC